MQEKEKQLVKKLSVLIGIFLFQQCGWQGTTSGHYAPVISRDGDRIAYVKRISRFSGGSSGFGLQSKIRFSKDQLLLCTNNTALTAETCLQRWDLPLEKVNDVSSGSVGVTLNWTRDSLRYRIELLRFKFDGWRPDIPQRQSSAGPMRIISNIPAGNKLKQEPTSVATLTVSLDDNPAGLAYPIDNRIIVRETQ